MDASALNSEEIKEYFGGQTPRTKIGRHLRADRERAGRAQDNLGKLMVDVIYSRDADDPVWDTLNSHFQELYHKPYTPTKLEYEGATNKAWGQTMASLAGPSMFSAIVSPLAWMPTDAITAYGEALRAPTNKPVNPDNPQNGPTNS